MRNEYIRGLEKELDSLLDDSSEFVYVGLDKIKVLVDKDCDYSKKGLGIRISKSGKNYLMVEQTTYNGGKRDRTTFGRNILGLIKGDNSLMCDHINRNPLDNRSVNLRRAKPKQNSRNRLDVVSTHRYKYVYDSSGVRKIDMDFGYRRNLGGGRLIITFNTKERSSCLGVLADCISMLYDKDFCLTNFDKLSYTDLFIKQYIESYGLDLDKIIECINNRIIVYNPFKSQL